MFRVQDFRSWGAEKLPVSSSLRPHLGCAFSCIRRLLVLAQTHLNLLCLLRTAVLRAALRPRRAAAARGAAHGLLRRRLVPRHGGTAY